MSIWMGIKPEVKLQRQYHGDNLLLEVPVPTDPQPVLFTLVRNLCYLTDH